MLNDDIVPAAQVSLLIAYTSYSLGIGKDGGIDQGMSPGML